MNLKKWWNLQRTESISLDAVEIKWLGLTGKWVADRAQQEASWELYVELITRVSMQPLSDDGLLREALSSLYSLFTETRELNQMKPSQSLQNWREMVAEPEDLDVAIKIFKRQIVIRQVMFTSEIPDRIGFYISKIKAIVEAQRKELNSGKTMAQVAKSLRDFQTMTNAFRDNELHTFERAWKSMSEHVVQVSVKAGNGQTYQKWVPRPYEDEMWLLAAA